jgi:hypothetical protein
MLASTHYCSQTTGTRRRPSGGLQTCSEELLAKIDADDISPERLVTDALNLSDRHLYRIKSESRDRDDNVSPNVGK